MLARLHSHLCTILTSVTNIKVPGIQLMLNKGQTLRLLSLCEHACVYVCGVEGIKAIKEPKDVTNHKHIIMGQRV